MIAIDPARRTVLETLSGRIAQTPPPNAKTDSPSFTRLVAELQKAGWTLMSLGLDPVIIAASPNRFNDIYISEWRAVRAGTWFSQVHDYENQQLDKDIHSAPQPAKTAYATLMELEAEGWRDLYASAMMDGGWHDESLFLVIQNATPWLVFAGSNEMEPNHVYALWDPGLPLVYFGEAVDRFDWDMQDTPALRLRLKDGGEVPA